MSHAIPRRNDNKRPDGGAAALRINGVSLVADATGALYWPACRALVVADLHLGKGEAFARRGRLLPPYDTDATLSALADAIARYRPESLICLGDSFHDAGAIENLGTAARDEIRAHSRRLEWIWVAGNHDPEPPADWGGRVVPELTAGNLVFRHEARADRPVAGELSGHFHPKASVRVRGKRISGRCFVGDGRRLILPAFGAYAGGLNVLDSAISDLFAKAFDVRIIGRSGLYRYPHSALVA